MALINTLCDYVSSRLYDDKSNISVWGKSILHSYERVSRLAWLPRISWSASRPIVVIGSRIHGKMGVDGRGRSHVVLSARDPMRMSFRPTSFSYDLKAYRAVCEAMLRGNCTELESSLSRIRRDLIRISPQILVVNSTIDPICRLWIFAAKELGIKIYCLQHGVYAKEIPNFAQEQDVVDFYIALDNIQRDIVGRNIDIKKIVTLGERDFFKWKTRGASSSICFVGEDWERYGHESLKKKIIEVYMELAIYLRGMGFNSMWYKPHPSESNMFGIDKYVSILSNRDIGTPDVFIGFSSSLLRDVSSRGRLAIQILDSDTKADNFQNNGYCLTVVKNKNITHDLKNIILCDQVSPFIRDRALEALLKI
jgi:hypothetical protein